MVSLEEAKSLELNNISNKLVCSICGSEREVPVCCETPMEGIGTKYTPGEE